MPIMLHITTASQWLAAKTAGVYQGDTLDTDGFIHASFPHQVLAVAQNYYREVPNLVLLVIDPAHVTSEIRYERGTHEDDNAIEQFPHIYGPLQLDAIIDVVPLPQTADGTFLLPTLP